VVLGIWQWKEEEGSCR